jgi:general secretion pathway protein A
MYEAFFGLCERPFDSTPHAKFLSLPWGHREALSRLETAIAARKGMILLTGDAGVGKTTLLNVVLHAQWGQKARTLYLCNPSVSRSEFVEFLARSFELSCEARASRIAFLAELVPVLLRRHQSGGTTVLVLDEAQSLPHDLLEELRLLANIAHDGSKLLQIVLAGHPEVETRLHESSLRPLKRGALRCELRPLNAWETSAFITERIRVAGGDPADVLSDCAIRAIYRYSRGIPRTICAVCDNVLVSAFAQNHRSVDEAAVDQVCRDFDPSPIADDGSSDESRADRRRRRNDAVVRVRIEPAIGNAREPEAVMTGGRTLSATVTRPKRRRFGFLSRRRGS